MSDEPLPEADRADGAPHPRETTQFFGHDLIEAQILEALSGERMHHAWLLTGPKGVGKATLAWRMARFLLAREPTDAGLFGGPAEKPTTLAIAPDHPVAQRLAALSDPGCLLIRRAWDTDRKRLKSQITVEEVRKLHSFFGLSATDGGHRVVIVDSADEMNPSAANALLKVLEEPPKGAMLILISHQPARLLPTVRSRCRSLRLSELDPGAMAKALAAADIKASTHPGMIELAQGSVGRAVRLQTEDGITLYHDIMSVIGTAPTMDRPQLAKLVERVTARGAETRLDLAISLLDMALSRLARHAAGKAPVHEATPGEMDILQRLGGSPQNARTWATVQQELSARIAHGRAVNIDMTSLLTDTFLRLNEAAR